MDLTVADFAEAVGSNGPVVIAGQRSRLDVAAVSPDARVVRAPVGIEWIEPAEMTVRCGAGTPVGDLQAALAEHGQSVALPDGGTVGGALAMGHSSMRRLGDGAMRDGLLQADYVSAAGKVVRAGGPTVKNVSGFDLCRLLVGSRGTLGCIGDVILRTRPIAAFSRWYSSTGDPWELLAALYRPVSVLWDGATTWTLLEGHERDVEAVADDLALVSVSGPPELPTAARWSMPPSQLVTLRDSPPMSFVAEIGVGVVHHTQPRPDRRVDSVQAELHRRIKHEFDPTGRLNPGVDLLTSS